MIKFVMCITKHPDMTREEFKEYWMNKHGPFFMSNADAMGAKKYVQSHTIDSPLNEGLRNSRGMLPEYDGVAEVWFESEEALMEGMSSPEGQRRILEFIGLAAQDIVTGAQVHLHRTS